MDYQIMAKELLKYLIIDERLGKLIQKNTIQIAKGELAVLIYLLEEKNGACPLEISQHFQINTSRVAAILNSLSKKQFIERKQNQEDKRKVYVFITDLGKEYALMNKKQVTQHISMILEKMGEKDAKEYLRIKKKMIEIMNDLEK